MMIPRETYRRLISNSIKVKENKYKNKKTLYDGIKFDSKKEGSRYIYLKRMEKLGVIKGLRLQVKYELQPSFKVEGKTIRAINYIADFVYEYNGDVIVEDVKSDPTRKDKTYIIKKKLFLYKYRDVKFKEIV